MNILYLSWRKLTRTRKARNHIRTWSKCLLDVLPAEYPISSASPCVASPLCVGHIFGIHHSSLLFKWSQAPSLTYLLFHSSLSLCSSPPTLHLILEARGKSPYLAYYIRGFTSPEPLPLIESVHLFYEFLTTSTKTVFCVAFLYWSNWKSTLSLLAPWTPNRWYSYHCRI